MICGWSETTGFRVFGALPLGQQRLEVLETRPRPPGRAARLPCFPIARVSIASASSRRTSRSKKDRGAQRGIAPLARQAFLHARIGLARPVAMVQAGLRASGLQVEAGQQVRRRPGLTEGARALQVAAAPPRSAPRGTRRPRRGGWSRAECESDRQRPRPPRGETAAAPPRNGPDPGAPIPAAGGFPRGDPRPAAPRSWPGTRDRRLRRPTGSPAAWPRRLGSRESSQRRPGPVAAAAPRPLGPAPRRRARTGPVGRGTPRWPDPDRRAHCGPRRLSPTGRGGSRERRWNGRLDPGGPVPSPAWPAPGATRRGPRSRRSSAEGSRPPRAGSRRSRSRRSARSTRPGSTGSAPGCRGRDRPRSSARASRR